MKKKKEKNQLVKIENFLDRNDRLEKNTRTYEKIMFIYSTAMKELELKIETIKEEFKLFYDYELIDHVQTRIKTEESIVKKMQDKNFKITYKDMIENINDIAGIRIICPLKKDIFVIRDLLKNINGIVIEKEKDYVTKPKESGYSSYHMILNVPITLSQKKLYVKVEVQIRTMAMDFWASLEHKFKYKSKSKISKSKSKELVAYAKIINKLDNKMMLLNK